MNRKLEMAALGCASAFACAGMGRQARIERIDARGMSATALAIESRGALTFVNEDAVPHQIDSSDCSEMASPALQPGQEYTVTVPTGPKVCHFQDGLSPRGPAWSGTVVVKAPSHDLRDEEFSGYSLP